MTLRAIAYPWPWRVAGALLVAISRTALPVLLALLVFSRDPPILPPMLMRAFTILVVTPALAAWIIERAFAAHVEIDADALVLRLRGRRVEVPTTAVAHVRPWIVPLPGSGVSLRLTSGRRLRYGLQLPDPSRLLTALAAATRDSATPASFQSFRFSYSVPSSSLILRYTLPRRNTACAMRAVSSGTDPIGSGRSDMAAPSVCEVSRHPTPGKGLTGRGLRRLRQQCQCWDWAKNAGT